MQDKVTIQRLMMVLLKGWKNSDIWGTTLTNQNSIQEEIEQEEQIEVGECLLSFDEESFVFQFAIQKYMD